MPRVRYLKTNFVNGELSPDMFMRSDVQSYINGARRCRNVTIDVQGGFKRRPGTEFIAEVDEISAGVRSDVRLFKFQFSTEQEYLFVFSNLKLTIFRNDVQVAQIATIYTSDELRPKFDANGNIDHTGIAVAADLDTMLVFHEDHPIQRIVRQGSDVSWAISDFETKNIQRFRFSDGVYGTEFTGTLTSPYSLSVVSLAQINDGNLNTQGSIAITGDTLDPDQRRFLQLDLGQSRDVGVIQVNRLRVNATSTVVQFYTSDDAVTWTPHGSQFKVDANSAPILVDRDVTCRYIALCHVTDNNAITFIANELQVFDQTAGINEVQALEFPNPSGTVQWVNGDTLSFLVLDEETDSVIYDADAGVFASRIQAALESLAIIGDENVLVTVEDAAGANTTDTVRFIVEFVNDAGQQPFEAIFINPISTQFSVKSSASVLQSGKLPGEPVWSSTRGYPRCGLFFQDRLWVAGSRSLPNYLWATRSLTIDDFNTELADDDFGIAVPADSTDVPAILYLEDGRHLQIFTTSGEFYIPISELNQITPNNIVLRRSTSKGCEPGLGVFDVDGGTFFVQRLGGTLRDFIFSDGELAYDAPNVSLLSSHLINKPVGMSLKRASADQDADKIYLVNTDGAMVEVTSLRRENVNAFALWNTVGQFHDVEALLDETYVAVIRSVGGVDKMFIEKLNENLKTDSAVYDFALGAPTSSAAISHLGTATVIPILDGSIQQAVAIASNSVTFERPATTSYEVGLQWPVALPDEQADLLFFVETLPVEVSLGDGAMHGRKRRVVDLSVELLNTTGLQANGNELAFRQFGSNLLDQPITPFSGLKRTRGMLGFDFKGAVVLGSSFPSDANCLGLSYGVQV